DLHSPFIKRRDETAPSHFNKKDAEEDKVGAARFSAKGYMDEFINPPDKLAEETERLNKEEEQDKHFPEHPERDVMWFILNHAPLKPWQVDILSIIRDEAYYFAPQGQT